MVFNSASTPSVSIVHDVLYWTGTDTGSYSLSDITRDINGEFRAVDAKIWENSGEWERDDSNYSTLPIATANLADGQGNYSLPTSTHRLMRVEVLKKNGDWVRLSPLDQSELKHQSYEEFQETDGVPQYFDPIANSVILKPAPSGDDITTTDGLRVWISRDIDEFETSDTDKEPGFDDDFHRLLPLRASYNWLIINDASDSKLNRIKGKINEMDSSLISFYGTRHRFRKSRIKPSSMGSGKSI